MSDEEDYELNALGIRKAQNPGLKAPIHRPTTDETQSVHMMNVKARPLENPVPERHLIFEDLPEEDKKKISEGLLKNDIPRAYAEMFPNDSLRLAAIKALMVNLYFEYAGNWKMVLGDERSVSHRTLSRYWQDPTFRAHIEALQPVLLLKAKGVVMDLMHNAKSEMVRLNAATRWLEAYDGETWDRGVRRQIVANKGTIANTLFSKAIKQEDYWRQIMEDRFAPMQFREAARAMLAAEGLPVPEQLEAPSQNEVDVTPPESVEVEAGDYRESFDSVQQRQLAKELENGK